MTDPTMFPDLNDYDLERKQLARRRQLAEQLLATRNQPEATLVGGRAMFGGGPGQLLANGVDALSGQLQQGPLDVEEKDLAAREAQQANALLSSIPASGEGRQQALLMAGQQMPSLRNSISALLAADERKQIADANRLEKSEQDAINRQERADSDAKYKRTIDDAIRLKGTPSIHITNSGGGNDLDRQIKEERLRQMKEGKPAPAERPLSATQEKSALELGGSYASMKQLAESFKDDYAGGPSKALKREVGKAAGGMADQATQDMTRWWSDQSMFDELPQRHALFGATLTGNEQKAWRDAAISPNLAPSVVRQRLATRQKIYEDASVRMRASAVAGGKSGKQFDAATGISPGGPISVTNDADYAKVPSGALYTTPDGKTRRKP